MFRRVYFSHVLFVHLHFHMQLVPGIFLRDRRLVGICEGFRRGRSCYLFQRENETKTMKISCISSSCMSSK
jgi:hypothetical protein